MSKDTTQIGHAMLVDLYLGLAITVSGMILTFLSGTIQGPSSLLDGLMSFHPHSIVELGILIMILAPLTGLLASMSVFLRSRDIVHAAISLLVVMVVGAALLSGLI